MKPYYEDSLVTLYHGDCRDVLPNIKGDTIVTDAPYGVGIDYDSFDDTADAIEQLAKEVVPLFIKSAPVTAVFTGVKNLHRWPQPTWTLCWYSASNPGGCPWGFSTWQPIVIYGQDPYLRAGKGSRPDTIRYSPGSQQEGGGEHPCPKPMSIMAQVIRRVTIEPCTIIDPFAGSGSTLLAARESGYKAIGIELSEAYCEIVANRLAQGSLWEVV